LYHRWWKLQALMETLSGKPVNVRSPKLKDLLYGDFKLPTRRNRGGGITTDEDAIVSLLTYCTDYITGLKQASTITDWKRKLLVLKAILEIRGLRQLLSNYIKNEISDDNRIRSIYKFAATETGRSACEGYVDGTGNNAQTFPRGIVEIPDGIEGQEVVPIAASELEEEVDNDVAA
jgi:DNA polymerase I-like protein with 3'-5' exonuclease and polymerase domains